MSAINVKNLTKKFGDFTAVNNISFSVEEGEIFAFLGPNGAGKSTTIKIMTTISKQTSGKVKVNEFDNITEQDSVRKSIGIIFQDSTLDEDLTAYENLIYHSLLYGIKLRDAKKRIEKLVREVGLWEKRNELIKNYSGGMKRRIEIARGLLHEPKIIFLDEPTLGLDVQTRAFLWKNIKEINKRNKMTVFLTTHNIDEAEKIATKIAIIDKGKILAHGTSRELKQKTKSKNLEDVFLKLTGYDIREEAPSNSHRMGWRRR